MSALRHWSIDLLTKVHITNLASNIDQVANLSPRCKMMVTASLNTLGKFPLFEAALACSMSNKERWPVGCQIRFAILRGLVYVSWIGKPLLKIAICISHESRPCAVHLFCSGAKSAITFHNSTERPFEISHGTVCTNCICCRRLCHWHWDWYWHQTQIWRYFSRC